MNKVILFDTNILVYAHHQRSPYQAKAQEIILKALNQGNGAVSWQNLLEFYNVVTDKRKVTKPLSLKETAKIIADYQRSRLKIIFPNATAYEEAVLLASNLGLKGKQQIFDALLVTTMKQWGIKTIYTHDLTHFTLFHSIQLINPFRS